MLNKPYCMSSYLAFRYIAEDGYEWIDGISPKYPSISIENQVPVYNCEEISEFISNYININYKKDTGLLLSGGIDSAILASFMPKRAKVYTIRFNALGAIDESSMASEYARFYGLDHKIIDVEWHDYLEYAPVLMRQKNAPLHAVEVGLYKAAKTARRDGISKLFLGNGADSTFGGMDNLLSQDWLFDEFVNRYTFLKPEAVLKEPVSMEHIYEQYRNGNYIDFIGFLKEVHGIGIIQAFDNALVSAGCTSLEPYECMRLAVPLDIARIRRGDSKYLLREIFKERYPGLDVPDKIPFARPMDKWLENWTGPIRPEFKVDSLSGFTGEQKWLLFCLENFLNLMDI